MRGGVEHPSTGFDRARADAGLAFQYIPDLHELVAVTGMMRARLLSHESGIRMGRVIWGRVKDHLRVLPRDSRPGPDLNVTDGRRGVYWTSRKGRDAMTLESLESFGVVGSSA